MRNILINTHNINKMRMESISKNDFNIKRLLNNYKLSQSQSIRFGVMFQRFIKEIIIKNGYDLKYKEFIDIYNTGSTTTKGKKDLDICFSKNNTIFYFELKTNLFLDSEKSKKTDDKILDVTKFLIAENENTPIHSALLTCWWEKEQGMTITPKTNILFMKDFFELMGENITKEEYYKMMIDFGQMI